MQTDSIILSVIIPTYNRPERLSQCLDALTQQTLPVDHFEVIVVDDGSQMSLKTITDKFEAQLSIHLIQQQNAGPASARNTGAKAAQGHYLVFTDDDCQPYSDWLNAVEIALNDFPDALIGGHTVNALPHNLYSTASQLLLDYIYEYYNQDRGNVTFFASNNFAMPRHLFHKIGGFDTSFPLAAGEDREFCDRWRDHNLPMHYVPAMQVYHAHPLTLTSFWRQHFNYGRGAFHFHQVRSKRQSQPIKVEPIRFYVRLITYPFSRQQGWQALSLSGLFFLSQIASVAGFFWEKRQQQSTSSRTTVTSS